MTPDDDGTAAAPACDGGEARVLALRALLARRTRGPVALVQTHVSWVLLTRGVAFKLKKPLRLPFLDFSTPQQRRRFCEEELRLNRRLAPGLYRAVLPVHGPAHAPHFGGQGEPTDWLLCMRRFPDGSLLSERLAEGHRPQDLPALSDQLAQRIARFHALAPRAGPEGPYGTPRVIVRAVRSVLRQLQAAGAGLPEDTEADIATQARALRGAWRERLQRGFVREVHGDLHLGNTVVLAGGPTAFDAVEFDPALRWIDVMNDLAFLTMDLRAHGRPDLAWRLLDGYLEVSGDHAGLAVLGFYEVYRAWVRALVSRLTPSEGDAPGSSPTAGRKDIDYLACARDLRAEQRRRPRLAVVCGLSGSGKSTLALALVQAAGAVRLRSDVERKRLFGLAPLDRPGDRAPELYGPAATQATYRELAMRARLALEAGYTVLIDAACLRRAERRAFESLAAALGVQFTLFLCDAAPALLRQRVAEREAAGGDASDADTSVLERQVQWQEALTPAEQAHAVRVDTGAPVDVDALARSWMAADR